LRSIGGFGATFHRLQRFVEVSPRLGKMVLPLILVQK
jgi:hypothetical protein